MAENYGTLEGTLDEHGVLSGEMSDRATLEGEIQFGSGGGGVLDVFQNGQSVVQGRYAYVTVPTFLRELRSDDYHNTVTSLEIQNWNGKADPSDIPTALSQLDNDANYVQDADYVHTDNNFTDEDKAAIGNIPENITDLSDVEVSNIQNGQVLKWDATQEKFVNADESGGGSGDVADVKVNGTSVVDPTTKEANIDLSGYAETTDIHNPTITIQKNGQNVDTFSLNQTTDKVIDISVPTKTSDLQNDSSFITNTVNNLANYYLKTQTYTQAEVDALIDAAINGRFKKVTVLPVTGEPNIIYLVPKATPETSNACDEYIWQDNDWELIGSTNIDLSGYVTDDELTTALQDYLTTSAFNTAIANYYTKTEVGNLLDDKVDKVSGKGLSTYDYDATAKGIVDNVTMNLAGKVDKVNGKGLSTEDYTTTEKNKLAGISTNANKVEASTTNGNIRIDGTETQVYDGSGKVDKVNGKGLSTNDYDNTAKGIVDGVTAALADKVDKETGKGLSTNDYTTAEKNKVATIDNKADKVTNATNGNLAGLNGSGNLTDSGWNGAKDTTSISGNPISISDLKANQLAVNPIITLEPIQDLHGQSKPYPAGGGYNKWDGTWELGGILWNTGAEIEATDRIRTGFIPVIAGGTYYFYKASTVSTSSIGVVFYNLNQERTGANSSLTVNSTLEIPSDTAYARFVFIGITTYTTGISINYPATYTSYAPYENICPISGYDKIEVLSCGKNLFDVDKVLVGTVSNGAWTFGASVDNAYFYKFKPNTQYTISGYEQQSISNKNVRLRAVYTDESYENVWSDTGTTKTAFRIVTDGTKTLARLQVTYSSSGGTVTVTDFQIEEGNITSPVYVPYNKTTDISESLGQTVYWGELDVRSGKFKVTHGEKDMGDLAYSYNSTYERFSASVSDMTASIASLNWLCECYETSGKAYIDSDRTDAQISARNSNVYIRDSRYTDGSSLKTALTGIKLIYPLTTPFYIQITPREISLLKDYAYVSTNGTSIALDYHNGELASLADVSQLGETVNALDRIQERQVQVNITSYNSSTNRYSIPFDGYITAYLPSGTGYVRVTVYDHNEQTMGIYQKYAVSSGDEYYTLSVKKGMKAMTSTSSGFSPTVTYRGMA